MNLPSPLHRYARAFGHHPAEGPDWPASEMLQDPEWDAVEAQRQQPPMAREWLFWALLMAVAIVALPLVGSRWTAMPMAATSGSDAGDDVLLWALPVVLALPFLLLACIRELALRRAARTPEAIGSFVLALLLALAALAAWMA